VENRKYQKISKNRAFQRRQVGLPAKFHPEIFVCPGKWGKIRGRMRFFDR
jgi:hypothetical protein